MTFAWLSLAIACTVAYHLVLKLTPAGANPRVVAGHVPRGVGDLRADPRRIPGRVRMAGGTAAAQLDCAGTRARDRRLDLGFLLLTGAATRSVSARWSRSRPRRWILLQDRRRGVPRPAVRRQRGRPSDSAWSASGSLTAADAQAGGIGRSGSRRRAMRRCSPSRRRATASRTRPGPSGDPGPAHVARDDRDAVGEVRVHHAALVGPAAQPVHVEGGPRRGSPSRRSHRRGVRSGSVPRPATVR